MKSIPIFEQLPDGWEILEGALTAPIGFAWITNGKSRFSNEFKRGFLKLEQ